MKAILCLIRGSAKAIAGLAAAAAVVLLSRFSFHLPAGTEAVLAAGVTAVIVYLIPNKACGP